MHLLWGGTGELVCGWWFLIVNQTDRLMVYLPLSYLHTVHFDYFHTSTSDDDSYLFIHTTRQRILSLPFLTCHCHFALSFLKEVVVWDYPQPRGSQHQRSDKLEDVRHGLTSWRMSDTVWQAGRWQERQSRMDGRELARGEMLHPGVSASFLSSQCKFDIFSHSVYLLVRGVDLRNNSCDRIIWFYNYY
jgi:hypothetical protein